MVWKHFWWSGNLGQLLRLIMVHRDVLTHCCSHRLEGWWHPLEKSHSRQSQHQRAHSSLKNISQTQLHNVLSCCHSASFGCCNHSRLYEEQLTLGFTHKSNWRFVGVTFYPHSNSYPTWELPQLSVTWFLHFCTSWIGRLLELPSALNLEGQRVSIVSL